jgi:predicted alpha-1,2-mannosidase
VDKFNVGRRSFLKLGGTAVVASCIGSANAQEHKEQVEPGPSGRHAQPIVPTPQHLVDLVNPLQGTDSTPLFSRGNTLPIVSVPFGMAHWALQSSDQDSWYFQPHDNRLQGVRCTHQLSPWLSDYGHATFLPFNGHPSPEPSQRASSYRPEELQILPHSLKLHLMRYRCWFELSPSEHGACIQFTFQDSGSAGIFIDIPGETSSAEYDSSNRILRFLTHQNEGGVQPNFAAYYAAQLDVPVTSFAVKELKGRRVVVIHFNTKKNSPVVLRIGTSFISYDQALLNLHQELGGKSFEQVRSQAAQVWEEALGRVRIEGATDTQLRTFYSCLYRTQLFPRVWHERDASGNLVHRSPYNGNVEPGVMYADHGYWDDYHAWYPMMLLLYPERLGQILQAWVNAFKEGGWFPQFPCPGYRGAMTGSLIDSVFGDAAAKGLTGFDLHTAYLGLKKHATQKGDPAKGYGRVAIEPYMRLGYVPCDAVGGAAAQTLDFAYGDFCIAQVARAVGMHSDAEMFERRSKNWRHIFDPGTGFLRGRHADGSWLEPFDPHTWGGAYVEGGAWQYRFNVLHDPEGLMNAMGGRAAFLSTLEDMLTQTPIFHVGSYGVEIHEMSEMAAVNFGQYAHSNQPVHNFLYMFAVAGCRDRTQYWAHRVLEELYSPDNFPGDEDTGSMSAWYILNSLGLFAQCPGKPDWTLGAPMFRSANIHFSDGRNIRIRTEGHGNGRFYDQVLLNGAIQHGPSIPHSKLTTNAELIFRVS